MKSMKLFMMAHNGAGGQLPAPHPQRTGAPFRSYPGNQGVVCFFCETGGHIYPRCNIKRAMIEKGELFEIDVNGRTHVSLKPDGPPLTKLEGKNWLETIQINKQRNAGPGLRTNSLTVGYGDISDTDEEEGGHTSVNNLYAAQQAQGLDPKLQTPSFRQDSKVQKREARDGRYPAVRNPRQGHYVKKEGTGRSGYIDPDPEPMEVDPADLPTPGTSIPVGVLKQPQYKGRTTRKMLRESLDADGILGKVLDSEVTLKASQVLGFSEVQQALFGKIKEVDFSEVPHSGLKTVGVNNVDVTRAHGEDYGYLDALYVAACPRVRTSIHGEEVLAIIDTGAEITAMEEGLAKHLGLPMSTNLSMHMQGAYGTPKRFAGICENVSLTVGSVTHQIPIYVIQGLEQPFLLGRAYQRLSRMKIVNCDDGSCEVSIQSSDGTHSAHFRAVRGKTPRDRTKEDLIRERVLNVPADI